MCTSTNAKENTKVGYKKFSRLLFNTEVLFVSMYNTTIIKVYGDILITSFY